MDYETIVKNVAMYFDDNSNKVSAIKEIFLAYFSSPVGYVHLYDLAKKVANGDEGQAKRIYNYLRKVALQLKKRGILEHRRETVNGKPIGRHYWTLSTDFLYFMYKFAKLLDFEIRRRKT